MECHSGGSDWTTKVNREMVILPDSDRDALGAS